jgi:hypothetical protein
MTNLKFLDKRDSNNLLLQNSAYALSSHFVDDCMEIISKYEIFVELTSHYEEQYIEFYFRKLLYYSFIPIANQLVIDNWDKSNCISSDVTNIDVKSFPNIELLNKAYPESEHIKYVGVLKGRVGCKYIRFKGYIKSIKEQLERFISNKVSLKARSQSNQAIGNNKIAFYLDASLTEGVDLNKRSSIYWFQGEKIRPSNVIAYFNSKGIEASKIESILNDHHFEWVNLRYWSAKSEISSDSEKHNFSQIIDRSDPIQRWLLREVSDLVISIDYWTLFFNEFNVRVHQDRTERGLEVIVKQIAMDKVNAISFSSQRSYLDNLTGRFYAYYPTDIFFAWGADSCLKLKKKILKKTNPGFDTILITGCFILDKFMENESKRIAYIKQNFINNGVKKTILFLDTNHALCNLLEGQTITTKELEKLYIAIFTILIEHQEIGLIIKPKKSKFFNSLNINSITKKALDTGRLHIVTEPEGVKPSVYANISDMVVSIINHDIPASIIECVILDKPGILYNYGSLNIVEPTFYSWANKKVTFDTIDEVVEALINFCFNEDYNFIGDWSNHILDYDPFLDLSAANRIEFYISLLLDFSRKDIDKKEIIRMANNLYSAEFGTDKIA